MAASGRELLAAPARRATAFFRLAEPGRVTSWSSRALDTALAAVATPVAIASTIGRVRGGSESVFVVPGPQGHEIAVNTPPAGPSLWVLLAVAFTVVPLAFRRRYPAAAFCVILAAALTAHNYLTTVTFAAVILAAYSAVLYSKFRRVALLSVFTGGVIVTGAFADTTPPVPARFTALLILVPTAAVAAVVRGWRKRAGDSAERLLRAQAQHEAETRRAVEAERARIAGELHDVVTHNVSVMVVQAGAARRILDSSPDDAREALRAVEASGRTAMTELRHLLGLLAPSAEEAVLLPQPDLGQVCSLVDRVRAAGLPVELSVTGARPLPPGVDLAAYRVVQEALTNVLKHAGQPRTAVRIEYLTRELLITVSDDGPAPWPPGAAGAPWAVRGQPGAPGGRGLIGLRERIAVYHGQLDVGPRPGGGWRLAARIPLDGAPEDSPPARAAAT